MTEPAVSPTSDLDAVVERTDDGAIVRRDDRRIVVTSRDGPDGAAAWTVAVRADGATVTKFGPFENADAVRDRVRTLLDAEIGYTVCCDG